MYVLLNCFLFLPECFALKNAVAALTLNLAVKYGDGSAWFVVHSMHLLDLEPPINLFKFVNNFCIWQQNVWTVNEHFSSLLRCHWIRWRRFVNCRSDCILDVDHRHFRSEQSKSTLSFSSLTYCSYFQAILQKTLCVENRGVHGLRILGWSRGLHLFLSRSW